MIRMSVKDGGMRLGVVCLMAASTGLPIAVISLSKVLLLITGVAALFFKTDTSVESPQKMWVPTVALATVFLFSFSLFWTSATPDQALVALGKYGKILIIPLMLILIQTYREACYALVCLLAAQIFLLVSSWLLYFKVPLIWANSDTAVSTYAVFSSYLDQGIMSGVLAAVLWHLKAYATDKVTFTFAIAMALLAMANVFVVFIGRTGHLVGLLMVSLAVFWAIPKRYRFATVFVPPILFFLVISSFDKVAQRVEFTKSEFSSFVAAPGAATSEDNRLDFWAGSIDSIVKNPLLGTGVGSWTKEYNSIQRNKYPAHRDLNMGGNPHQEYLLWGVQLGVGGILLLVALFGTLMRDFWGMDAFIARAGQCVVLALAASCLFNSSIYDDYIGDYFFVMLGILLAFGYRRSQVAKTRPKNSVNVSKRFE